MQHDGNGWVSCSCGRRHWGRHGAAGLLVTNDDHVLLQQRATSTHEGGTWAVPGGARDSDEDAFSAARREAAEETTLDVDLITPVAEHVADHGDWSYTTIVARAPQRLAVHVANWESDAVRWYRIADVEALPLHHGFAASWPALRELIPRTRA